MRRADRLFQLIQLLRHRRVTTAAALADRLEVSERTIYRDVQDLVRSGVPIQGEAGVGYRLPSRFDLPPMMFTEDEIEALALGARVVREWADPALARAAASVLAKVEAVLPERLARRVDSSAVFAVNFERAPATTDALAQLRGAIRDQRRVRFAYHSVAGERSARTIRPLCLVFYAPRWLLSGWCELRGAFRNFRVDRIDELVLLESTFDDEPGRTLADFLRAVQGEGDG